MVISPFDEGLDAKLLGKPRESCPYPEGSQEREDWLDGWDSGRVLPRSEEPYCCDLRAGRTAARKQGVAIPTQSSDDRANG